MLPMQRTRVQSLVGELRSRMPHSTAKNLKKKKKSQACQRGKGGGEDGLGVWDKQIHTTVCRVDDQQGFTVWHRELHSVSSGDL